MPYYPHFAFRFLHFCVPAPSPHHTQSNWRQNLKARSTSRTACVGSVLNLIQPRQLDILRLPCQPATKTKFPVIRYDSPYLAGIYLPCHLSISLALASTISPHCGRKGNSSAKCSVQKFRIPYSDTCAGSHAKQVADPHHQSYLAPVISVSSRLFCTILPPSNRTISFTQHCLPVSRFPI
ncbi:hypothetical protein B0T17DRAFT_656727 [Bombardia bombarda]|uniref:Uncharacterized protein n=1 Tax=Bombardia bombarda TaxID=252184 RepID=A0AA39WHQ5_9PEZI|nr:hypothetical protein B0T17DRAFT_656727 [Bombardia bombarda]